MLAALALCMLQSSFYAHTCALHASKLTSTDAWLSVECRIFIDSHNLSLSWLAEHEMNARQFRHWPKGLCKQWAKGTCDQALNCKFAHHNLEEEAGHPPGFQGGGAPDGAASSQAAEALNSNSDSCEEARPGVSQELCEATVWARIYLNHPHPSFNDLFLKFLIGKNGLNMKKMSAQMQWKANFRIRGIGSRHLEENGDQEACVPLQLVVALPKSYSILLRKALWLAIALLLRSVAFFRSWSNTEHLQNRLCPAEISSVPMFFIGEVSLGVELLIMDLLREFGSSGKTCRAKNFSMTPGGGSGDAASQPKQIFEPPMLASNDGYVVWHWVWDSFNWGWSGQWVQNSPGAGWRQLQQQAPSTAGTIAWNSRDELVANCSSISDSRDEPAKPLLLCKASANQRSLCWQLQQRAPGTAGTMAWNSRDEPVAICDSSSDSRDESAKDEPPESLQLCKKLCWQLQQQTHGMAGTIDWNGRDEPVATCSSISDSWDEPDIDKPAKPWQLCKAKAAPQRQISAELLFAEIEERLRKALDHSGGPVTSNSNQLGRRSPH